MSEEANFLYNQVSIIIPAYNEESGLGNTLDELLSYDNLKEAEIIVVDDGSTDGTYNIALGKVEKGVSVVLRHKVNSGYGSAIATGIKYSSKKYIVWYDSDGQHRPEDLIAVIDRCILEELDYCIGVRGSDSFVDKSRILGKLILKKVLRLITNQPVTDFNSGLRIFKRDIILRYISLLPKRFGASTVTTLLMQESEYYGGEVPIVVRQRVGKSTVKQFRDGFRTIALMLNIILLFRPMKIFGALGLCTTILGTLYGTVIAFLQKEGFPTLSVIVIVFGLQILFFGIISEQIGQMRRENMEERRYYKD